jgi:transposase-like protein
MTSNKRYTKEYKEKILNSLMPPQSKTVSQIVKEEGINRNTVYSWVRKARNEGASIPNSSPSHEKKWRKEDKFKMVMETYRLKQIRINSCLVFCL